MEELYHFIENKIREAGYTGPADGEEIYHEISDEIENKENGAYLFLSKKEEDIFFEYKIDIMDEEFNLSYIRINTPKQVYYVNLDE